MARIAKAKRCPFCASADSFVECSMPGLFYRTCNSCGSRGPDAEGEDCDASLNNHEGTRNATRLWNKRSRRFADQGAA